MAAVERGGEASVAKRIITRSYVCCHISVARVTINQAREVVQKQNGNNTRLVPIGVGPPSDGTYFQTYKPYFLSFAIEPCTLKQISHLVLIKNITLETILGCSDRF